MTEKFDNYVFFNRDIIFHDVDSVLGKFPLAYSPPSEFPSIKLPCYVTLHLPGEGFGQVVIH